MQNHSIHSVSCLISKGKCVFHLVQCQVKNEDRLMMATQQQRMWILTLTLGFEKERYGSLDGLHVSILMEWIYHYF